MSERLFETLCVSLKKVAIEINIEPSFPLQAFRTQKDSSKLCKGENETLPWVSNGENTLSPSFLQVSQNTQTLVSRSEKKVFFLLFFIFCI
jgi:hypothetical protein